MLLKVDLLKFYDTITEKRVFGVFREMGYAKNLAWLFAQLTTCNHRLSFWTNMEENERGLLEKLIVERPAILPQGAPTSPMLANIIATRLDRRFMGLSQKMGFRYSRYADDLTFSVSETGQLPTLKSIHKIVEEEGFFINPKKVKFFSRGMKQYVTGLTVTNGVNISKKYRKEIEQHLYFAMKFGPENHLKKWREKTRKGVRGEGNIYAFQDWLFGHISFIMSINKKVGTKFLDMFNRIDWSV